MADAVTKRRLEAGEITKAEAVDARRSNNRRPKLASIERMHPKAFDARVQELYERYAPQELRDLAARLEAQTVRPATRSHLLPIPGEPDDEPIPATDTIESVAA